MKQKIMIRVVCLVALFACYSNAGSFSYIAVFGDSLSDNGNLYAALHGAYPPSPPYFAGRASNGPVAVEDMASQLGSPLLDYAWAGATTGVGNTVDNGTAGALGAFSLPGVTTVYNAVKPSLPISSDALYVVWAGPNDMLGAFSNPPSIPGAITTAVSNIDAIIVDLQASGAVHILVPGMPDLGATPRFEALGAAAQAGGSAATEAFNLALISSLPAGVTFFDTSAFLHSMINNPAAFGLTNVTEPCFNGSTVCATPNQYLFWDDIHPTATGHGFLGEAFADAVPEPSTWSLAFAGLLMVVARMRRQAR